MTKGISCVNQLIRNHICIIEVKLIVFQKFSILKILMMLYHENFFGGSVGCQVRLCDCVCIEWKKLNHRWSMSSLLWAWCILRHVLYINTQSSQSHLQLKGDKCFLDLLNEILCVKIYLGSKYMIFVFCKFLTTHGSY